MMQSCASAAELRGGGSILDRGAKAMSVVGTPLPRFFIHGSPSQQPQKLLRGRAQHDPLRDLAGGRQAPQRNQQLAGESQDHRFAGRRPAVGGAPGTI